MNQGLNKVELIGTIRRKFDLARFTEKQKIAFTIECKSDEKYRDYITCEAWNLIADQIDVEYNVGDPIMVEGSIKTSSYEDKETGKKIYKTIVNIYKIIDIFKNKDINII